MVHQCEASEPADAPPADVQEDAEHIGGHHSSNADLENSAFEKSEEQCVNTQASDGDGGSEETDACLGKTGKPEDHDNTLVNASAKMLIMACLGAISCASMLQWQTFMAGVGYWTGLYGETNWLLFNLIGGMGMPAVITAQYFLDHYYNQVYGAEVLCIHPGQTLRVSPLLVHRLHTPSE